MTDDTIAAISTPFGEGAIALLRLSGRGAAAIAGQVVRARIALSEAIPRMAFLGRIFDGNSILDEAMVTLYRAPASYTGEDVVEIACHGGILLTRRILDLLVKHGARIAAPGEFTQRAFLNGKLDLTQAEAVMDLIRAQTDLALRSAHEQLSGRLGQEATQLRDALLDVRAHVEAYIDFPEEDIDPETGEALDRKLVVVVQRLEQLLATADQGRILREGVRTVIVGSPNAGKSSLLNRLVGFDRAIVSEIPGTTRDTVEEYLNIRGIPLRLVDTAGLRHSEDHVEKQGIARSRKQIELADLILHVVDASRPMPAGLDSYPRELRILNKADLGIAPGWNEGVPVSCITGEGFPQLAGAIYEKVTHTAAAWNENVVAINARHQACLVLALEHTRAARTALGSALSAEFIAVDLHAAMDALGEMVGKLDTEDILGKIFSSFCIGK